MKLEDWEAVQKVTGEPGEGHRSFSPKRLAGLGQTTQQLDGCVVSMRRSGTVMHAIAIGVATLIGCASSSTKQLPAPSNAGRTSAPILVRFAGRDEFPVKVPTTDEEVALGAGCDKKGPPARAYYQPVVDFAREHMIGRDDGPVHEVLVGPDSPPPRLRDGTNIVVDPRGALGELRIVAVGPPFYAPGEKWAETRYCLHVIQQGATTTIAVEEWWTEMR